MAKERCKATIRRFLTGVFSPRKVRSIIRFTKLLDRSFGGFIEGQLLDAIVVGIISYFVFTIFGIPTPHLIATIIAVTNVIPIFGPFIGGIPAAFLVLLAAPEKTLLFINLIFVIQQIDGNIICPHILGDKINISSLATIIAIVTMGGLFGILGMIIGVPIFAVAIQLIQNWTINSLRNKGLDTSLEYYYVGHVEELSDNTDKSNNAINTLFNKIATFLKNIIAELKSIFLNQNKEK
jgi:predicted PurR-regulated permease PerM